MDGKRLEKVNKLIQKELGDIFQKELKPAVPMLMITVTHVRVTSDLGYANVYLSVFGVDDKKKVVASTTCCIPKSETAAVHSKPLSVGQEEPQPH